MININLLPPELKLQRLGAKKNASLVTICLVVVIVFAISGLLSRNFKNTVSANLSATKSNIDKEVGQLDAFKDFQELAYLINDRSQEAVKINQAKVMWSQVFQDLTNNTPQDVQIANINAKASETPNFTLQGNTTSEREVVKFKEKLESSTFFKNVTFKSSSLTTEGSESSRITFSLEFDLEQKSLEVLGVRNNHLPNNPPKRGIK